MQESQRLDQFRQENHLGQMTRDFHGLTGEQIEKANRLAANLQVTKFMFHAWANIDNSYIGGCRGNVKYRILRRLSLIPLYAWPYKKIVNRTSGHISGDIISGNVRVGTKQEPRTASVDASVEFLVKAYSKMSGIRTVESLTAMNDESRREAFMLFHAVMETRKGSSIQSDPRLTVRGRDLPLEDLVDTNERGIEREGFFTVVAPLALRFAMEHGIRVPDYLLFEEVKGEMVRSELFPDDMYKFRREALPKGVTMIRELHSITRTAYDLLAGPSGVLVRSRNQLNAARMGQADAKMQKDDLDVWGERQVPSFSWQTDVDRMREAQAPVVDELRKLRTAPEPPQGADSREEELELLREQNKMLRLRQEETDERLRALEASRLVFDDETRGSSEPETPAGVVTDQRLAGDDVVTAPAATAEEPPNPATATRGREKETPRKR